MPYNVISFFNFELVQANRIIPSEAFTMPCPSLQCIPSTLHIHSDFNKLTSTLTN